MDDTTRELISLRVGLARVAQAAGVQTSELPVLGKDYGQLATMASTHGWSFLAEDVAAKISRLFREARSAEDELNSSEGWGLFEVDGRYQIQRNDELDVQIFASDADALIWVCAKAATSRRHRAAVELVGTLVES